jgi:hypothetical protein
VQLPAFPPQVFQYPADKRFTGSRQTAFNTQIGKVNGKLAESGTAEPHLLIRAWLSAAADEQIYGCRKDVPALVIRMIARKLCPARYDDFHFLCFHLHAIAVPGLHAP